MFKMYNAYEMSRHPKRAEGGGTMEKLCGNVTDFFKSLHEAGPSDCKRLFAALTEIAKTDNKLVSLVLALQEVILLYGIMQESPYMGGE